RRRAAAQTASVDLLRARLEFSQIGTGGPNIVVTSAGAGEGKSTVAASLGAALARAGKRVICVDADVRRPALYRYLRLPQETPGLLDVVRRGLDIDEALLTVALNQSSRNGAAATPPPVEFEVLLAGNSNSGDRGPRLDSHEISRLIETLQERADYVILDSPPLLVADAFLLAAQAGNVLVVARHGRTTKDQAESVRATLEELGVRHVGVVLTNAPPVEAYP
ncbi:MAG: CpsD/CapB family tyrosine-protein kinase, partial [Gaiellaceae bacterium]